MRNQIARCVVLCFLLLAPCVSAISRMNINYDVESWPLNIAIESQDTNLAFESRTNRLTLPSMTLLYCAQGNLAGWNSFAQITPAEAECFFTALSDAEVSESTATRFSKREKGASAWLSVVARLSSGSLRCMDFCTTFDGQINMCIQTPDYKDVIYLSSESETLWNQVNQTAQWQRYYKSDLESASSIEIYDWRAESGRSWLLGTVEDQATIQFLATAVSKSTQGEYLCASRVEMVFMLPDGRTLSAYVVNPDSDRANITIVSAIGVSKVPRKQLSFLFDMIDARDTALVATMTGDERLLPEQPGIRRLINWLESEPTFYHDTDGTLQVWDPASGKTISSFSSTDRSIDGECPNPAVFIVESQSMRKICSLETGNVLWEMVKCEDGRDFGGESEVSISGWYSYYVEGRPDRLVVTQGSMPNTRAYLTDNHGRQTTTCYQSLDALVWQSDRGVFMFSSYFPADYEQGGDWTDEGNSPYVYGPTLRYGLIDQDGNILAGAYYTDIKVLSPTQYALCFQGRYSLLDIDVNTG